MTILRRWGDAAAHQLESFPFLGQMQSSTRSGFLFGLVAGTLLFCALGGVLGSLNRGAGGALIGALSGALLGAVLGSVVGSYLGTRYLPQQGWLALALELDDAEARYGPGSAVVGRVRVTAENTLRLSGGKVLLGCHGIYVSDEVSDDSEQPKFRRETRQYLLQEALVVPASLVRRGASYAFPFRFTLPDELLPTHYGYVCTVRWSLHTVVDAPDVPPFTTQREIVVRSPEPALPPARTEYQSTVSAQVCQLSITLPRVTYAQGEPVHARAHLTALESFDVDEIRAVLLRVESTSLGDDHTVYVGGWDQDTSLFHGERRPGGQGTTYVWMEGEHVLSGPVGFTVTETRSYPIALDIPAEWRPTFTTKDGRALWKVGVVMARSERTVRVFHEIIVHTAELQAEAAVPGSGPDSPPSGPDPAAPPIARTALAR